MTMTDDEQGIQTTRMIEPDRVGTDTAHTSVRPMRTADPHAAAGSGGIALSGGWSMRRAIELLDEAIDRMGSQLARAADASMDWSDEPPGGHSRRPVARAGRRAELGTSTSALGPTAEAAASTRGPELP